MEALTGIQGWLQLGAVGIIGVLFYHIITKTFPAIQEQHAKSVEAARNQYMADIAMAREDFRSHIADARQQWREEGKETRDTFAKTLNVVLEDSKATREQFVAAEGYHKLALGKVVAQIDSIAHALASAQVLPEPERPPLNHLTEPLRPTDEAGKE